MPDHHTLFDIRGLTAVITGGGGVLGSAMAKALAQAGANVVVISRRAETSGKVAAAIHEQGGQALPIACDITDHARLEQAHAQILSTFGGIDILVNAAGGNQAQATTSPDRTFFELDGQAINTLLNLNLTGTILSCQVFGQTMVKRGTGSIVNISSMSAQRPLTRVAAYGAAKAAINNFTQWLAVHMAQEYSAKIRVNAISPGFFLTEQNRFLLTEVETGAMTPRGQAILNHTPMGQFGAPEDLIGTLLWLASPASTFVTGTVIPVDGGFSAFSGV
jgi:NAD(P)-dependent dehydrogenase (short-subunit alcohol dehydrogenase family)